MTSSSPTKIDTPLVGTSKTGSSDNLINFESIQKITVSGECPLPRTVSRPIEIQNTIKNNHIQIKEYQKPQKQMPMKPILSSTRRNLAINYNDLDELFNKFILCSKEMSEKIVTENELTFENPFRRVYTLLSLNNRNKIVNFNNNNSNIGTEQKITFKTNLYSNVVPFSVSTPKIKKEKSRKFLGEKTNRNNTPVVNSFSIKSSIIPSEISLTSDNPKTIIKIPREDEEGGNTQNSSNNSVDTYNHKVTFI